MPCDLRLAVETAPRIVEIDVTESVEAAEFVAAQLLEEEVQLDIVCAAN